MNVLVFAIHLGAIYSRKCLFSLPGHLDKNVAKLRFPASIAAFASLMSVQAMEITMNRIDDHKM